MRYSLAPWTFSSFLCSASKIIENNILYIIYNNTTARIRDITRILRERVSNAIIPMLYDAKMSTTRMHQKNIGTSRYTIIQLKSEINVVICIREKYKFFLRCNLFLSIYFSDNRAIRSSQYIEVMRKNKIHVTTRKAINPSQYGCSQTLAIICKVGSWSWRIYCIRFDQSIGSTIPIIIANSNIGTTERIHKNRLHAEIQSFEIPQWKKFLYTNIRSENMCFKCFQSQRKYWPFLFFFDDIFVFRLRSKKTWVYYEK